MAQTDRWNQGEQRGELFPTIASLSDPRTESVLRRRRLQSEVKLNETDAKRVLQHLADLWSYDVSLAEIDTTGTVLKEYVANPRELAAAAA